MLGKAIFLFSVAVAVSASARGVQVDNIKFRTIGTQEGLSHSNVRCILQDAAGFMWFGTKDGLNRYDGYGFTTYRKTVGSTKGMLSSDVQKLEANDAQQIWVSNENGMVDLLDIAQERFLTHALEDLRGVNCLAVVHDGTTWVGTGSRGVFVYGHADKSLVQLENRIGGTTAPGNSQVSFIKADSRGRVWVGTADKGLTVYGADRNVIRSYAHDPASPNSLGHDHIRFIFEDSKQRIWVGTYGGGLNRYRPGSDDFERIDLEDRVALAHADPDYVLCMEEDDLGNLWVGRENAGLSVFNPASGLAATYIHASDDSQSVSDNTINCIKKDRWGNLWIGTANGGVSVTNPSTAPFAHYLHRKGQRGLSNNIVNVFFEDSEGHVWIGTDGGGLNRFDESTGDFDVLRHHAGNPNSICNDYVLSVNQDNDGNIWVGTWGGGVTLISPQGRYRHFQHIAGDSTSLANNYAYHVFKDRRGRMWVGTYGGGLCLYDETRQVFKRFVRQSGNPRSLSTDYVLCMEQDYEGNIWIGMDGGGLSRFIEERQEFETRLHVDWGLSNNRVVSIHADPSGMLWLATNFGLNKFNPETGENTVFFSGNGLASDVITAVAGDRDGNVWLSSNHGISVLKPDGSIRNYTIEDGLQDNEFRYGKLLSRSGKLYFGGKNGFNTFNPTKVGPRLAHTPVVFTRFQVFNKDATIATDENPDGLLEESISVTREVTIPYHLSVFSIDFAMLHAGSTERKLYQYKLDGFDSEWQDLGSKNSVTFTNLDPGHYRLQVKGTANEGEWPAEWSQIDIVVTPPFWKTWWFVLLEVLVGAGAIIAIFYFRMASIKARNQQLEKEVQLRTHELSETNAYLQESNEQIKVQNIHLEESNKEINRKTDKILEQQRRIMQQKQELEGMVNELQGSNKTKDKLFAIISHDLKNPIAALHGITSLLHKKLPQLDPELIEARVKDLFLASESINELIVNLLDWSRVQAESLSIEPTDVNVYELVMKNVFLVQPQLKAKGIHLKVDVSVSHVVKADKYMLDAVVRNLLNNSIKFTGRNGGIALVSEETEQRIAITFKDSGIGMTAQQIREVELGDSRSISYGTLGEPGTRLGLQIVKEFLALNDGRLTIASEVGLGSTFTVSLPRSVESAYASVTFSEVDLALDWPMRSELTKADLAMLKGKRLLIVEDNDEVRNFMHLLLSGIFELFEARNGSEGQKAVHEFLPDIVITDMIMPVMDGLAFSRQLKADYQTNHIPVILLTGENGESGKLASYEAGCDVFIGKPINKEILLQVILNLIKKQEVIRKKFSDADGLFPEGVSYNRLDEEFIQQISDFVDANLADADLDYRRICELTAMSRTVLYSKLKALTGMGVHDFIKGIRLRKAITLLQEGRLNISQVAYEVGFVTPSYFTKCFTKKYGKSPKEHLAVLKSKSAQQIENADRIT